MKYRFPAPGTRVSFEAGRGGLRSGKVVAIRFVPGSLEATVRLDGWLPFHRRLPTGWIHALDPDAPHIEMNIPD